MNGIDDGALPIVFQRAQQLVDSGVGSNATSVKNRKVNIRGERHAFRDDEDRIIQQIALH